MNSKAIEVCKRNELWALIKKVSNHYGRDDLEWLKAFAKEMVENCSIDKALACFRDLSTYCDKVSKTQKEQPTLTKQSKETQYQPPFRR